MAALFDFCQRRYYTGLMWFGHKCFWMALRISKKVKGKFGQELGLTETTTTIRFKGAKKGKFTVDDEVIEYHIVRQDMCKDKPDVYACTIALEYIIEKFKTPLLVRTAVEQGTIDLTIEQFNLETGLDSMISLNDMQVAGCSLKQLDSNHIYSVTLKGFATYQSLLHN